MELQSLENQRELTSLIHKGKVRLFQITYIETPGPGQYRAQSDFGFYDAADTLNTMNSLLKTGR